MSNLIEALSFFLSRWNAQKGAWAHESPVFREISVFVEVISFLFFMSLSFVIVSGFLLVFILAGT